MKDYSQSGEQAAILEALYGQAAPPLQDSRNFLDLGAYHPTVFSNTRALYECGWRGVMIEAAPGPMRSLIAEYGNVPRMTLIQAAVALAPGLVEMHISDDAVSTANEASYQVWREAGGFVGKVLVPAITLGDIYNRYGGAFQFVNIDVEGGSVDLFLEMLKLGPRPQCACVEFDDRLAELMTAAGAAGYKARVIGANVVMWL